MSEQKHKPYGIYEAVFKRPLDCILAAFALIVLSPLIAVVAAITYFDIGSPVIFKQKRIGMDDKEFDLLKFRSMTDARDENGVYLPDEERITKFGGFLRRTSIDELPSLVNIVRGDLAIIGPRPLPVRYLPRYSPRQRRRHEVRPGLSAPSTVRGRNAQSWADQLEGDVQYVDHITFLTDLKAVWATIGIVLSHEGATAADGAARNEFIGCADTGTLEYDAEGNYMKIT